MSGATEREVAIRTFLALPVPREVIEGLQALQGRLRPVFSDISWSRPENQHLTIRFYGRVPAAKVNELHLAIQQVCEQTRPFTLRAQGLDSFAGRVIWVGLDGALEQLHELESRTAQATRGFGDHEEQRKFQPHLTLGRIKRQRPGRKRIVDRIRPWATAQFGEWTADHLQLMRSDLSPHGARYTCLAKIALAGERADD